MEFNINPGHIVVCFHKHNRELNDMFLRFLDLSSLRILAIKRAS
jgi:hypothetical protein